MFKFDSEKGTYIKNITSTSLNGNKVSYHVASFDDNLVDLPQHSDDRPLLAHFSTLYNLVSASSSFTYSD